MFLQSFTGVWNRLVRSPIFWLLFLVLLLSKMLKVKIQVKGVPTNLLQAMERALANTPYRKQLTNWLAISKMETGGFKSSLYTLINNPWGMRPSTVRRHAQSGVYDSPTNGQFARYASLEKAAEDILLYMQARQWPTEELDLYSFVSLMKAKGYFVEPIDYYYKAVKASLEK